MIDRFVRSTARAAANATLAALTAAATVPAAYLGVVTAAGLRRSTARPPSGAPPSTRFAVMVPAHDEATGIADTLHSFRSLDYPAELFSVHVVADNCVDDTAGVVRRHGWQVHERTAPDHPGKGPALNWLHDRLVASDEPFDAVVVVDADTTLDVGFLRAIDRALRDGAIAAQGFYSVREPEASPSTSFRYAALACRHHLRPLGRNRLGASSGLYGNGMAFRRDVLERHRWTGHLVEDAEFQMELLLDGHVVTYVPDAVLWAEMPQEVDQATSQNQRWERGRLDLARRYVPTLARRLVTDRGRRVAIADSALDHIVPPLSVLVAMQLLVAGLAAAGSMVGNRVARRLFVIDVAAIALTVGHVIAGLFAVSAPLSHLRSLVKSPGIVLWKVRLWMSVARPGSDVAWTRTRRNTERAATEAGSS